MKQYQYLYTDQNGHAHLIRFDYEPVQNGQALVVINEVSLVYDGEVIGESPTISHARAHQIVFESDMSEWEEHTLHPTPKTPTPKTVAAIKAAHEAAGLVVVELEQGLKNGTAYDIDFIEAVNVWKRTGEAWQKVSHLFEYYNRLHSPNFAPISGERCVYFYRTLYGIGGCQSMFEDRYLWKHKNGRNGNP